MTTPIKGTPIQLKDCRGIKVGDTIKRMLAGVIPMDLKVTKVDDALIYCATPDGGDAWTFDRATGVEVDEELGFGPAHGITGSFITEWTSV